MGQHNVNPECFRGATPESRYVQLTTCSGTQELIQRRGWLNWENTCQCHSDKGASPLSQPTLSWESQLHPRVLISLGHMMP